MRSEIDPQRQAAAQVMWQRWLARRDDEPPWVLTMHQAAEALGLSYYRVKILRKRRWDADRFEARRTGQDPSPYIPLRTALCRPLGDTTSYLARDVYGWMVWAERLDVKTGKVSHASPPGRPELAPPE